MLDGGKYYIISFVACRDVIPNCSSCGVIVSDGAHVCFACDENYIRNTDGNICDCEYLYSNGIVQFLIGEVIHECAQCQET